ALTALRPDLEVTVQEVTTRGDREQRPFAAIGGKGLFVKELELTLTEERADAAVHSAKDLTAELARGCVIACVPERQSPADVVVGGSGETGESRLASLQPGARVGTSSMRRRALLAERWPDVQGVELRGNIDTRLEKVARGEVDVAVLAAAGLNRLGAEESAAVLDLDHWIPAPGQGALAVEVLKSRTDLIDLFAELNDSAAAAELAAERSFAETLEGGCTIPLGCLARLEGERLVVTGFLGHPGGGAALRDRVSGPSIDAEALGREVAQSIFDAGGRELVEELRELAAPPIPAP
ncbi:MAG: hydroxymethylbilane synthase, partial [Actinomycetota bacterium]